MVLALILWAYVRVTVGGVTQNVMGQLELKIPLETRGAGTNLIPYELSVDTIAVTLRGEVGVVSELREGLVRAYVDVQDMVAGSHWPEVQVLAPPGVQIVQTEPKSVNVKLSPPGLKEVPLQIELTGIPKAGYKVGRPTFSPRSCKLRGPEALLNEVARVTGLVPLDDAQATFTLTVQNLTPVNDNGTAVMGTGSSIKLTPDRVTAVIPINVQEAVYTLPVLLENVKVTGKAGYTYDIEVDPQFVQVRTEIQDRSQLPQGISTKDVRFDASAKVQERDIGLEAIEGLSIVGDKTVKLRVVPQKKAS